MRLLHARSLKFQDFNESSLPPYAILSHTWDASQEVSLQEMTSPYLPSKKGYAKITETCRLALSQGLEYAWIDTCCIDKTSSAELTESINSMFRWYQKARVCYAYLSDFHTTSDGPDLAQCAWFTRGWTLQELIAPPTMEFYNSSWEMIGTRYQLEKELSSITGIPILAFGRLPAALRSFSVAQKMSWASSRVTTRTEDVAYCLLGLFGVHMPLIYGEGSRAFHRLQEEIARRTDDLTLFAWVPAENNFAYCSLLASSPAEFGQCGHMVQSRGRNGGHAITNKGVKMTAFLLLQPTASTEANDDGQVYRYMLHVGYRVTGGRDVVTTHRSMISIYVAKLGRDLFIRETRPSYHEASTDEVMERPLRSSAMETFYLLAIDPSILTHEDLHPDPDGNEVIYIPHHSNIDMNVGYSPICWNARTRMCYWPQSYNDVIALSFVATGTIGGCHGLHFGLLFDFRRARSSCPRCLLLNLGSSSNRLFFLLFIRTPSDPMKWEDIEYELPEINRLTNTLQVNLGGTKWEITASVEKRNSEMNEKAMSRPTLYMAIKDTPGTVNSKSDTDVVALPIRAKAKL